MPERKRCGSDPLEEGIATHSSILASRIPWTEEPGGLQSIGLHRVGQHFEKVLSLQPLCFYLSTGLVSDPQRARHSLSVLSLGCDSCSLESCREAPTTPQLASGVAGSGLPVS